MTIEGKTQEPKGIDKLTVVLSIAYVLLLVAVILFKLPFRQAGSERAINLVPLLGSFTDDGGLRLAEVINNVLIFIPAGIYVCMLRIDWAFTRRLLLIVGTTVTFEIIQFVFAMGKTDITDILTNTLGGVIGIGLYSLLKKIFKDRTDKIVNATALVLVFCVVVIFAYLSVRH